MKTLAMSLLTTLVSLSLAACHSGGGSVSASGPKSGSTTYTDSIPRAPGAPSTPAPVGNSSAAAPSGPVTDGGGQTLTSEKKAVSDSIDTLRQRMLQIIYRIKVATALPNGGADQAMNFMMDPEFEYLVKEMKINVQDAACEFAGSPDRAGSATVKTKSICLSLDEISKVNPESLDLEVLALGFHEVTHLMGGDETAAQKIQKWLTDNQNFTVFPQAGVLATLKIYDGALEQLGGVVRGVGYGDSSSDICQAMTVYKDRQKVLTSQFSISVPLNILLTEADFVDTYDWDDSDACKSLLSKGASGRLKVLEVAKKITAMIMLKKEELGKYISTDKYSYTLPGQGSLATLIPVFEQNLKSNRAFKLIKPEQIDCKLIDQNTSEQLTILKNGMTVDKFANMYKASVVDDNGEKQDLQLWISQAGVVRIAAYNYTKDDLVVINSSHEVVSTTGYLEDDVDDASTVLADMNGYRSIDVDFGLAAHGHHLLDPVHPAYHLHCELGKGGN